MSVLRLDAPDWVWVDAPAQAGWWLIDASFNPDLEAIVGFYDALPEKPQVALLAARMNQLPRPSWTFFKPPVSSGMIFNWVQPMRTRITAPLAEPVDERSAVENATPLQLAASPHVQQPWKQGLLRLRKWPNVARYGHILELTVACSRLLAAPATYHQVLQWNVPVNALDRMLADAHLQGMLEFESGPAPSVIPDLAETLSHTDLSPTATDSTPEATFSRWDLVRRLLGRFSRR